MGKALAGLGFCQLSGVDLSPGMAAAAATTGVYDSVEGGVDLNEGATGVPSAAFDAAISCGYPCPRTGRTSVLSFLRYRVFTFGHVRVEAVATVLAKLVPGGFFVFNMRLSFCAEFKCAWQCPSQRGPFVEAGFRVAEYLERLERDGVAELVAFIKAGPYHEQEPSNYYALRKL